jgi:hypothetical protein
MRLVLAAAVDKGFIEVCHEPVALDQVIHLLRWCNDLA